jgi:hypothetical protein
MVFAFESKSFHLGPCVPALLTEIQGCEPMTCEIDRVDFLIGMEKFHGRM